MWQRLKRSKRGNAEATAGKQAKRSRLDDSKGLSGFRLKKIPHCESLFTALNRPLLVPLLRLPPELRSLIWQYVLCSDDGIFQANEEEDFPEPGLLSTCTQIRREASGIFYSQNKFVFTVTSYCPSMVLFFQRKFASLRAGGIEVPRGHIAVSMQGSPSWKNLLAWLKWSHKGRAGTCERSFGDMPVRNSSSDWDEEFDFICGLLAMTIEMQHRPWEVVEPIIARLRLGLQQFDPMWAQD